MKKLMKLMMCLSLTLPTFAEANEKGLRFGILEEILAHIAIGGVWSSQLTFVNLGDQTAMFPLRFFRPNGEPWMVEVEGVATDDEFTVTVVPGTALTVNLRSTGDTIETGWAEIDQPSETKIGGHAIFTDSTPGRPVFEAVVPLSTWGDDDFFMPFDNTNGNNTCLALANSSTVTEQMIAIEFTDGMGNPLPPATRMLGPLNQESFCLVNEFPGLAGQQGAMHLVGSGSRLSALAFRFNPGGAFTTFFTMSP